MFAASIFVAFFQVTDGDKDFAKDKY